MMQALSISLELIDRCQNHVLPGSNVRRRCMHNDYTDEKRAVWAGHSEWMAAILNLHPHF